MGEPGNLQVAPGGPPPPPPPHHQQQQQGPPGRVPPPGDQRDMQKGGWGGSPQGQVPFIGDFPQRQPRPGMC